MLKLPVWGNSEKEETHTAAPYIKDDSQVTHVRLHDFKIGKQ